MTAGIKPSLASLSENIASSAATTISQTAINPSPPPKAATEPTVLALRDARRVTEPSGVVSSCLEK